MDEEQDQAADMAALVNDAKNLCHDWIESGRVEPGKTLLGVLMFGHRELREELSRWLMRDGAATALNIASAKIDIDADLMALRMAGVK